MVLKKGTDESIASFWNADYGCSIFKETMSRNKFLSIPRYIQFDDKQTKKTSLPL